jgi:transposase
MTITRVGVDIAKSVFHVHGVDRHDQVLWTGKYSRQKWLDAFCRRVPVGAEIGIEACASSHHWARQLQARGYHEPSRVSACVQPL